jgi:hypothetical protein
MYGHRKLSFNVTMLGERFFENPISVPVIDLIVHEISHERGMHTEESYHKTITMLAGELTIMALKNPKFFEVI